MLPENYGYTFLGRMRRPEGLPPKLPQKHDVRLVVPPAVVFELSLCMWLLLAIAGFTFLPAWKPMPRDYTILHELVKLEEIEATRQIDRSQPPPRPIIPVEVPPDEALDDVTIQDTELHFAAGGIESILSRIVYPEVALKTGMYGKVVVAAYINERGDAVRVEVVKGIGGGCDEAALEAVRLARFIADQIQSDASLMLSAAVPSVRRHPCSFSNRLPVCFKAIRQISIPSNAISHS